MKRFLLFLFIVSNRLLTLPQEFTLGWEGGKIIPDAVLLDAPAWTCNQTDLVLGDSGYVTSDLALNLHWKFGPGFRSKFVQCYTTLTVPVDLSDKDIIGIDLHGKAGKTWIRNIEFKFESGSQQATHAWEDLAHINRWCERIVIRKSQFSNYENFRWDSITLISLAVTMKSLDNTDIQIDSGIVSMKNLIAQSTAEFIRTSNLEKLTDFGTNELETIRLNAATALKNRQNPNGLLTTWEQDGSSWLYGQGLALSALTEEGIWNNGVPGNEFALSAEKLAHFLISNQRAEGYWPRAWNASTGVPIVELEGDNTIWMGDFPWIAGSLAGYYHKSGDHDVLPAILAAKNFLYDLIELTGKVNTINIITRQQSEISNYEGYAAVLYFLMQLSDTIMVHKVMDYVMSSGWDDQLKFWKEGPGSSRPVLLVNTWLAALAVSLGYNSEPTDALSLIGKLLYTRGSGDPYGFDGIGPIATWYEGTLSYIASGGPGSNDLFTGIVPHINTDGTVPAYNENLGSMAGIWAVDWSSLDATSWLYYAAAQYTPFGYSGADPDLFTSVAEMYNQNIEIAFCLKEDKIFIINSNPIGNDPFHLSLYSGSGVLLGSCQLDAGVRELPVSDITQTTLLDGNLYLLILTGNNQRCSGKAICLNSENP